MNTANDSMRRLFEEVSPRQNISNVVAPRRFGIQPVVTTELGDEAGELGELYQTETPPEHSHLQGKKVGMVVFSSYPADPRPRRAAESLIGQGMSVDYICIKEGPAPTRERFEGLDILRLSIPHSRSGKLAYAYEYSSFILMTASILATRSLKRPYDLIYIHNMPDVLVLSALLPKALGAKVILDLHDPMPELMMTIFNLDRNSRGVKIVSQLEKWSIACADLVITVNLACKRIFSNRSCRPEKIGVVMNSPSEEIFQLRSPRSYHVRGTRSVRDRFVMMYHGSLVERNGLDLAVRALKKVKGTIPSAELKVFGRSTPFLEQVMEQVRSENLQDCVHYYGPKRLEELIGEIQTSDLGVIPNHRNAFTDINTPTRIFEYLALGKPVITPRTPGIQDYFGEDSLLFFESGDADDLAHKIEFAYADYDRALAIAERGQEVYMQHRWSYERNTFVKLVSELMRGVAR